MWFETGPDAKGSQHSSDRLRCAVHIRDDHGSLQECVGLLLVYLVGKGEDPVRVSIVCQEFSDMLFLLSLVISKSAETLSIVCQEFSDMLFLLSLVISKSQDICQYGLAFCRLLWNV